MPVRYLEAVACLPFQPPRCRLTLTLSASDPQGATRSDASLDFAARRAIGRLNGYSENEPGDRFGRSAGPGFKSNRDWSARNLKLEATRLVESRFPPEEQRRALGGARA